MRNLPERVKIGTRQSPFAGWRHFRRSSENLPIARAAGAGRGRLVAAPAPLN